MEVEEAPLKKRMDLVRNCHPPFNNLHENCRLSWPNYWSMYLQAILGTNVQKEQDHRLRPYLRSLTLAQYVFPFVSSSPGIVTYLLPSVLPEMLPQEETFEDTVKERNNEDRNWRRELTDKWLPKQDEKNSAARTSPTPNYLQL